jgi:hypothetical protein
LQNLQIDFCSALIYIPPSVHKGSFYPCILTTELSFLTLVSEEVFIDDKHGQCPSFLKEEQGRLRDFREVAI